MWNKTALNVTLTISLVLKYILNMNELSWAIIASTGKNIKKQQELKNQYLIQHFYVKNI